MDISAARERMETQNSSNFQERFVLPGDDLLPYISPPSSSSKQKVVIAKGLRKVFNNDESIGESMMANTAGIMKCMAQDASMPIYSVQSRSGFYAPSIGDQVSIDLLST